MTPGRSSGSGDSGGGDPFGRPLPPDNKVRLESEYVVLRAVPGETYRRPVCSEFQPPPELDTWTDVEAWFLRELVKLELPDALGTEYAIVTRAAPTQVLARLKPSG